MICNSEKLICFYALNNIISERRGSGFLTETGGDISSPVLPVQGKGKICPIPTLATPKEQVKTAVFRYVFAYYNTIIITSFNPDRLPPDIYRERYFSDYTHILTIPDGLKIGKAILLKKKLQKMTIINAY